MYHFSCYRNYTHSATIASLAGEGKAGSASVSAYDEAFTWLAGIVEQECFSTREVRAMRMDKLTTMYSERLIELGVSSQYRRWLLKKRLVHHFGSRVTFVRQSVTSPESLVSSSLSSSQLEGLIGTAVSQAEVMQTVTASDTEDVFEVDSPPPVSNEKVEAFHTAQSLRDAISLQKPTIPAIPHASDLSQDNAPVPNILFNFLATLLLGPERVDVTDMHTSRCQVSPTCC